MALASSSSKTSSPCSNSILEASRLTMMVPLFFLVLIFGRGRSSDGAESAEPLLCTDELLDVLEVEDSGDWTVEKGSVVMLRAFLCSRRLSRTKERTVVCVYACAVREGQRR